MSLAIIGIAIVILLMLSVYLLSKVEQERGRHKLSIEDIQNLSLDTPPVIVSQMKNGEVQQTLCYFSPYDVVPDTTVVEVDVRERLFSRLRPDGTIAIPQQA